MMKPMVLVSLFTLFQTFALGAGLAHAAVSPIAVDISATPYVTVFKAQVVQEETGVKIFEPSPGPARFTFPDMWISFFSRRTAPCWRSGAFPSRGCNPTARDAWTSALSPKWTSPYRPGRVRFFATMPPALGRVTADD